VNKLFKQLDRCLNFAGCIDYKIIDLRYLRLVMHLFNDIFQSVQDDLNEICHDFNEILFGTFYITFEPRKVCHDRSLRTLADYNQAIQSAPTDANLFYHRGTIRHHYCDDLGAIADYSQAIDLNPHLAEAYAARAMSYTQIDRLTDALSDGDRAVELKPDLGSVYGIRAVARSYSGDHQGAIADFTRCTQLNPDATAYYNLGVSQATIALYAPALASLTKSLDFQPEIATYYARSSALAGLGDEFGANRDYSEALARETPGSGSLYPNDEHAYYFRALARLARGRREEAKADFQATISICDRKHNSALRQLATAKIAEIDRG
jgi:tetratricopeptide (TPR) repeat protein